MSHEDVHEPEPGLQRPAREDNSEDEMDMTPMVDITFLLLIFLRSEIKLHYIICDAIGRHNVVK